MLASLEAMAQIHRVLVRLVSAIARGCVTNGMIRDGESRGQGGGKLMA